MPSLRPFVAVSSLLILSGAVATAVAPDATPAGGGTTIKDLLTATPADPHLTMSTDTCVKCHAAEVEVWQRTPHARTFDELHRRPEAIEIARKLNLRSIKHDGRCVACHYTQQAEPDGRLTAIAGVSCESCHGASRRWIDVHHDYGGEGITRSTESPQHRHRRIAQSVALGMRNPENAYLVAQSCYRCHTTGDEELVNVGGHSTGSLDFELVAWSQGTIHHNFVRSDGKINAASSIRRIRMLFVVGMVADLEASLRATAAATSKATFGINAAGRAQRAGQRLISVQAKIQEPLLARIIAIYESVPLKLNQRQPLTEAADQIAQLGFELADTADPDGWGSLDPFLPSRESWK